ncbi:MAG: WhiB family transcriptional regulator [Actinobacteria bacterium]|nr:WhiB family transcriptional regulator [Actinomycetota bacterium]
MRPSTRIAGEPTTTKEPSWHARAACKGLDAAIFYPSDDDVEAIEVAKAVCAACPVSGPCLEHALSVREKSGVWGGCTERDRRRIIRQRRRSA